LDYKSADRLINANPTAKKKISISNLEKIVNIINELPHDLLKKGGNELCETIKKHFNRSGLEENQKFKKELPKMSREELLQQAIDDLDALLQSGVENWRAQVQGVREKLELAKELPAQPDTWAARVKPQPAPTPSAGDLEQASPSSVGGLDLPSFEENLAKFGRYEDRTTNENAIQFLERAWGHYINRFNGGKGDYLYLDRLRELDNSLAMGIRNFCSKRGNCSSSDYVPNKSIRVKKETADLLDTLKGVQTDVPVETKVYRLQKAATSNAIIKQ